MRAVQLQQPARRRLVQPVRPAPAGAGAAGPVHSVWWGTAAVQSACAGAARTAAALPLATASARVGIAFAFFFALKATKVPPLVVVAVVSNRERS